HGTRTPHRRAALTIPRPGRGRAPAAARCAHGPRRPAGGGGGPAACRTCTRRSRNGGTAPQESTRPAQAAAPMAFVCRTPPLASAAEVESMHVPEDPWAVTWRDQLIELDLPGVGPITASAAPALFEDEQGLAAAHEAEEEAELEHHRRQPTGPPEAGTVHATL